MTGGLHQLKGGAAAETSPAEVATTSVAVDPPRRRWMTRVLLPVGILVIMVSLLVATAEAILPATPVRVVPVVVRAVSGTTGTVTVQAPGWLEPDPHPYYVTALADGVVREVRVLAGDRVEEGDVVARLVDDDARIAVRRAEAMLAQRHSDVQAAQADLDAAATEVRHLVERTRAVAVTEARVVERRAQADELRAQVAVEQATLAELRDEYERKTPLVASGAVPAAVVRRLELRVEGQEATVRAAEARRAVIEASLVEVKAEFDAARRDRELLIAERRAVARAEAAVANAEAAVMLAEASRDDAQLRLDRMEIRSTVSGIVMRRLVSPGSALSHSGGAPHSSHVVHLYDPQRMQVRADVPLADAAHVTVGQAAQITVEVLPDQMFEGRVTRVVHEADIQKNTVEVKVAVDAPSEELKPEMLAKVRFLARAATSSGAVRQRVFAPDALISRDGGAVSTLVVTSLVDDRGRVERRGVTIGGQSIEGWIEVEDGLRPGDLLIADPDPDLAAGDRIRITGEPAGGS